MQASLFAASDAHSCRAFFLLLLLYLVRRDIASFRHRVSCFLVSNSLHVWFLSVLLFSPLHLHLFVSFPLSFGQYEFLHTRLDSFRANILHGHMALYGFVFFYFFLYIFFPIPGEWNGVLIESLTRCMARIVGVQAGLEEIVEYELFFFSVPCTFFRVMFLALKHVFRNGASAL